MVHETSSKNDNENNGSVTNQKWILKQRPTGVFSAKSDVELLENESLLLTTTKTHNDHGDTSGPAGSCGDNEVIVKVEMLSVDAFVRTMMDEKAYHGSIGLGQTLPAVGYGTVVAAGRLSKQKVGSRVAGMLGAQQYAKVSANMVQPMWNLPFLPLSASLGLMGLTTGITAYTGTFFVTRPPQKKETVVVTAASGAIGSLVCQLAKNTGARVVGIAGGEKKTTFLKEQLKLDDAVDYKSQKETLGEQLDKCCPNGIDFVYDNVGGETLDELLARINPKARIVICGAVSQYSGNLNHGKVRGPCNYLQLAEKGAEMKGFNVMQYLFKAPIAMFWLYVQYLRGKLFMPEHVETGIQSFPTTLEKLFNGGHVGKMLVSVSNN